MKATHLIKVWFYVSRKGKTIEQVQLEERAKWDMALGDALENVEVEKM